MFEELKGLVESLSDLDFSVYKNAKDTRKILQGIKVEAGKLRFAVSDKFKSFKNEPKAPKVKKEKPIKAFTKEQQLGKKELKVPTVGIDED